MKKKIAKSQVLCANVKKVLPIGIEHYLKTSSHPCDLYPLASHIYIIKTGVYRGILFYSKTYIVGTR